MAQKIAAPAETLRQLARQTALAADRQEEKGLKHNAQDCREAAEAAYEAAAGYSSNLVAINARHAATICAFAGPHEYKGGLRSMLEHQGYW